MRLSSISSTPLLVLLTTLTITHATPVANPVAAPRPQTTGVDQTCSRKYCNEYANVAENCLKSSGFKTDMDDDHPSWFIYKDCMCEASRIKLYEDCLACFTQPSSLKDTYMSGFKRTCGDTDGDDDDDDTDTSEQKKNNAGTLKAGSGFKMAGVMVVAGGLIGAM